MTTQDPVSIIPNDQVRALMTAMLAGDSIQEDIETILTDDAELGMKRLLFLEAMGLKEGRRLYDVTKKVKRAGALQRSVAAVDLYLKLRMIKHPDMELDYYGAGGDGPKNIDRKTAAGNTDVKEGNGIEEAHEGPTC